MNAPAKAVAVPMAALYDLFDMGNYGRSSGDEREVSALDFARNTIRDLQLELKIVGSAASKEDPPIYSADICLHLNRLSERLGASLAIIEAIESASAQAAAESEAAQ